MLNIDFNLILFFSFIISIYPIYGSLINVIPRGKNYIAPGINSPYNTRIDIEKLYRFFLEIPERSKILIAYKNPQNDYNKIFSGYRYYNEPIQYVASLRDICLFPDWYIISENNKEEDDESFWIDSEEELYSYMVKEHIEYVIIPDFYDFELEKFVKIDTFIFNIISTIGKNKTYKIELFKLKG
ncbi:hypothetical protein [Aliarcobacter cryaerophilus]|uniref:hypothetical protein n=1 Tax=Aliarcobacter cryaerophilus TaxID=28198 RepID=UPI001653F773|nr:hypothetical protein [Aliarcobacter cryaerophilus]QNM92446.1 hypothetical protein HOO33_00980 [Aliarcobacter cryaerophilus]